MCSVNDGGHRCLISPDFLIDQRHAAAQDNFLARQELDDLTAHPLAVYECAIGTAQVLNLVSGTRLFEPGMGSGYLGIADGDVGHGVAADGDFRRLKGIHSARFGACLDNELIILD